MLSGLAILLACQIWSSLANLPCSFCTANRHCQLWLILDLVSSRREWVYERVGMYVVSLLLNSYVKRYCTNGRRTRKLEVFFFALEK